MNKLEREITRLERVRDYILANPDGYNQASTFICIVGLAKTLARAKAAGMSSPDWAAKHFGISVETAINLFNGAFDQINKRMKAIDVDNRLDEVTPKQAAAVLNYIIKQKLAEKSI